MNGKHRQICGVVLSSELILLTFACYGNFYCALIEIKVICKLLRISETSKYHIDSLGNRYMQQAAVKRAVTEQNECIAIANMVIGKQKNIISLNSRYIFVSKDMEG
uniref:Uncharacterized protein n=1 Tax=Glossina pallidipes TaxID=7398 RepID=A0A1B0A698_GLOPL